MHPRVKAVESSYLRASADLRNGSTGLVDGGRWLQGAYDTVFAPLRDPDFFA
jgi:hypothetical protein